MDLDPPIHGWNAVRTQRLVIGANSGDVEISCRRGDDCDT